MDTVILAAGKGDRLNGIMPRFWKPLLVIDGKPLIRQAVENAISVTSAGGAHPNVIVVAAPENAAPICDVLGNLPATVVVQRRTDGPGAGLVLGMRLCDSERVLVLMGDNITPRDDVKLIAESPGCAVGIRRMKPTAEVERFTRYMGGGKWVEKTPLTPQELTESYIDVWLGPLVVRRFDTQKTYNAIVPAMNEELPIGPYLGRIAPSPTFVEVSSFDIGTPETVNGAGH